MFGAEWREHDVRYQYATEWLDFVRKLGFKIEFDPDDPAVRIARLDLRAPAAA